MKNSLKVQSQLLEEGMILAQDVEHHGLLLIAANTRLTRKMILQFIQSKIPYVWVYDGVETGNMKRYQSNYQSVQNILLVAAETDKVELHDVQNIVESFSKVRFQRSLLKYIYGIRKVDEYTYQHSLNVGYMSMLLAKWSDYPDPSLVAMTGFLHDLGKVKIDSSILNKPGQLTEEEWKLMKRHSFLGYDLLLNTPEVPKEVHSGVLYHHERMNGSGYPQGLSGDKIPEIARMIAIVDVFDAMTSDRVYRDKRDVFEVLHYLHNLHDEFDLKYLRIFTENMLDILVGEEVLLTNNKTGKIVFNNHYKPFSPLVLTEEGFVDLSEESEIKVARVL